MPLYKTITVNKTTKVLIWKIEESYEALSKDIKLTEHCRDRVNSMKSEIHQRGFMSVRHLLAEFGYTDFDLYYDDFGKPHLKDGKQISITHSFKFAGIIVSDHNVGIDIEMQREKIQRIAQKFVSKTESDFIDNNHLDTVRALTVIWGAKESLYKLYATAGLSFEEHITIQEFEFESSKAKGFINHQGTHSEYDIAFTEFEGFTCVYALPSF